MIINCLKKYATSTNTKQFHKYKNKYSVYDSSFTISAPTNDNIFVKTNVNICWSTNNVNKRNSLQISQTEHLIKINSAKIIYDKFSYFNFDSIFSEKGYISDALCDFINKEIDSAYIVECAFLTKMVPESDKVRQLITDHRSLSATRNTYKEVDDSYKDLKMRIKMLNDNDK